MLSDKQIKALKQLGQQDDAEPISEGQRYDFSIRWGTVLAGRLRRLVQHRLGVPARCAGQLCLRRPGG